MDDGVLRDGGVPDVNELSSFSGGGEVVDVDNQRVKGDYLAGVFVRWTCCQYLFRAQNHIPILCSRWRGKPLLELRWEICL